MDFELLRKLADVVHHERNDEGLRPAVPGSPRQLSTPRFNVVRILLRRQRVQGIANLQSPRRVAESLNRGDDATGGLVNNDPPVHESDPWRVAGVADKDARDVRCG